jgi:hypothetical protein
MQKVLCTHGGQGAVVSELIIGHVLQVCRPGVLLLCLSRVRPINIQLTPFDALASRLLNDSRCTYIWMQVLPVDSDCAHVIQIPQKDSSCWWRIYEEVELTHSESIAGSDGDILSSIPFTRTSSSSLLQGSLHKGDVERLLARVIIVSVDS